MKATVINVKRPGPWGSPIMLRRKCPVCGVTHKDGGSTITCYRKYLWQRLQTDPGFRMEFWMLALELRNGAVLRCACGDSTWGKPLAGCHSGVMVKAAMWLLDGDWSKAIG